MQVKYFILIATIGTILFWSSGCRKPFGISGNNLVTTETRQMVSFDEIVNEGSFNVYITQDSIYQVIVEAESNLIPHIKTRVNGNSLIIETKESLKNNNPMNIYVKTPTINGVYLKGSGYMNLDSLNTDHLQLEISGSGNIRGEAVANSINTEISGSGSIFFEAYASNIETKISGSGILDLMGESNTATHTISGSGDINAFSFIQKECTAKISGSGNMYLHVIDYLDVNISGSGTVFYIGDPQLTIKITGSGSVVKQ